MLDSFLRDCGFRVQVLKERASECPLPMKGHFFFNTWTTGTMLAGLLDSVDREHDVVILDRGIFDALIWLHMQAQEEQTSPEEKAAFEAFVKLERWRRLVDRVCLIRTDAEIAMQRENHNRLLARSGSIMNKQRLGEFNRAMDELARTASDDFVLTELENSANPREGALRLIDDVLGALRAWCDPEIAVISREDARQLVSTGASEWSERLEGELLGALQYRRRSLVENDNDFVQVMACGVQTHGNKVFVVVRRPPRGRAPSHRDHTAQVWRGCHLVRENDQGLDLTAFREQLAVRLRDDLHLGSLPEIPEPRGVVWDPQGEEPRHLAVVFRVNVSVKLAEWLDEKNFKTNGRGYRLESSFVPPEELHAARGEEKGYTVEGWSRIILDNRWLR